jgi:hypothetical protein
LRRAVAALTPEPLVDILLGDEPRAEVEFATTARADGFAAVLDELRRRADRQSSAVGDRLIELFATRRNHSEVRELLATLRKHGRNFDAGTVLIDVALGRPPADAAAFVRPAHGAAEDGDDGPHVSRLVVEHRRPREVAAFIAGFGATADSRMRDLLPIVVEATSADWMIRLARALRANDLPDAPSAIVSAALHRDIPSAKVAELLDGLNDCGPDQRGKIEHELCAHLRHDATPVEELAIFVERNPGPGGPEKLVREVVAKRDINHVAQLRRHARTSKDDQLERWVIRAVAETRKPLDLMDFVKDVESETATILFTQVAQHRDGDTIGHLLSIWQRPDKRPVAFQWAGEVLPDLFAAHVSPDRLLVARRYLESVGCPHVLDPVIRMVLAKPRRLGPPDLAALLADLSRHSRRRTPDVVHRIPDRLVSNFDESGNSRVDVAHLARVVAEVWRNEGKMRTFARIVAEGIDKAVTARDNTALAESYLDALWACGADERARAFKKRIDP